MQRWQVERLTPAQVRYLREERFTLLARGFQCGPHTIARMEQKKLTWYQCTEAIMLGRLTIFTRARGRRWCLWRDPNGVCVAVDHDTGFVVTAYRNPVDWRASNAHGQYMNRAPTNEEVGLTNQ